jgi:hypothetical protein
MNSHLLLLTSALHYLAIIPILCKNYKSVHFYYQIYGNTIILSTTCSILWHYYNTVQLQYLDYYFAFIWFIHDLMWSVELNKFRILVLNLIIFGLNIHINYLDNYAYYHSIWHVASAIKCIYVSYLLNQYGMSKIEIYTS